MPGDGPFVSFDQADSQSAAASQAMAREVYAPPPTTTSKQESDTPKAVTDAHGSIDVARKLDTTEIELQLVEGLRLADSVFGPDDPRTVKQANALVEYYFKDGRFKDVAALNDWVMKTSDIATAAQFQTACEQLGETDKARAAQQLVERLSLNEGRSSTLDAITGKGSDHEVYPALVDLAYRYYKLGDQKKADELFKTMIARIEDQYGNYSDKLYMILPAYSEFLKETGKHVSWVDTMMAKYSPAADTSPTIGAPLKDAVPDEVTSAKESEPALLAKADPANEPPQSTDGPAAGSAHEESLAGMATGSGSVFQESKSDTKNAQPADDLPQPDQPRETYSSEVEQEKLKKLNLAESVFGAGSLETVGPLEDVAEYIAYSDKQSPSRADSYFHRALQILHSAQNLETPMYFRIANAYTEYLRVNGRTAEADNLHQESQQQEQQTIIKQDVSSATSTEGGLSVQAATAVAKLAAFDAASNRASESARLASESMTIMNRLGWPDQAATVDFMTQYAAYLSASGQGSEAEAWKARAAALAKKLKPN